MEQKPRRVQLSRRKGWRMPENTVSVARPTKWGNPYKVGEDGITDRQVAVYRFYLWLTQTVAGRELASEARAELRGKNLACWCPIGGPCHADVLLAAAKKKPR